MRSTERASTFARAILLSAIAAVPAAAQERMTRISQRHRQEGDGNSPAAGTNIILSPQNDYLKEFTGRGR